MDSNVSALERAFQLAKSGHCRTVSEIRMCLNREGYDADQVRGPQLSRQLEALIQAAQLKPKPAKARKPTASSTRTAKNAAHKSKKPGRPARTRKRSTKSKAASKSRRG